LARSKHPADNDAHRWRIEAERYRPTGDAVIALGGAATLDYLSALGCTQYVATHGVSRSYSPGTYQMGVGHPQAQGLLRAEQRHLASRARMLLAKLDTIVGESPTEPLTEGHVVDLLSQKGQNPAEGE